ncbi:MAG: tRNA (N6-threonylcarbamoyladenosine(37)-N6)-methyltransferase TrmO [bacterium]|nr:tRNA (N6-threonylcarbamoyladenosine(37)-N6)-methyltransferase TrmO [bacterium]
MSDSYHLKPVGIIRKTDEKNWIEIFDDFTDALLGLDGFSHIYVFYWFDQNDSAENRSTLQVHPRKDPGNPLTGVFATHSPQRPNLIALTLCKLESIVGNIIHIEEIDAYDGSPVIDIKCYIPGAVPNADVRLPEWV